MKNAIIHRGTSPFSIIFYQLQLSHTANVKLQDMKLGIKLKKRRNNSRGGGAARVPVG